MFFDQKTCSLFVNANPNFKPFFCLKDPDLKAVEAFLDESDSAEDVANCILVSVG
jgi:hypothetical protein